MNLNQAKQVLEDLKKRRDSVVAERRALEEEFATLTKTIEGLEALCASDSEEAFHAPANLKETLKVAEQWIKHMPFADAVRTALKVSLSPLTPVEVRKMLESAGFPIHQRTDPMVGINVCLKRLVNADEVEMVNYEGRKAYRWIWKHAPALSRTTEVEALIRTMNRHGSGIAGIDPYAADRQITDKYSTDIPPNKPKRKIILE
jgi:hypothetical protein